MRDLQVGSKQRFAEREDQYKSLKHVCFAGEKFVFVLFGDRFEVARDFRHLVRAIFIIQQLALVIQHACDAQPGQPADFFPLLLQTVERMRLRFSASQKKTHDQRETNKYVQLAT